MFQAQAKKKHKKDEGVLKAINLIEEETVQLIKRQNAHSTRQSRDAKSESKLPKIVEDPGKNVNDEDDKSLSENSELILDDPEEPKNLNGTDATDGDDLMISSSSPTKEELKEMVKLLQNKGDFSPLLYFSDLSLPLTEFDIFNMLL